MAAAPAGPYVIGVDGGTESLRAGVFSARDGTLVASHVAPYSTEFPQPGWAEQRPEDWWTALGAATQGAVQAAVQAVGAEVVSGIVAMCVDTTCCTVCALDAEGQPVRPALLWMDMRSAAEAAAVAATGDVALRVNSAGHGPVSAEWMVPKSLWLKNNEPHTWERAARVCEYQDYINFHLTGQYVGSLNNASVRWHYGADRGWPMSLLEKLGVADLLARWPSVLLAPGQVVGQLTPTAALHTGLPAGLPVAQGGADAFIGMLGLAVIEAGEMALLTGSSHLHLGMAAQPASGRGMFGSYTNALLPGLHVVEGGQTSTGSVVAWFKRTLCAPDIDYHTLNQEAEGVPPGCDGLLCLDHFQGNRTPHTDALSRGALAGLTLAHGRGHVFRSLMEGVAFGTRLILDTMAKAGFKPSRIAIAGGATRSPLWLQIHADVCGVPFVLTSQPEAPMLGCAILAAVAAGVHPSVQAAAGAMVSVTTTVTPRPEVHAAYQQPYQRYCQMYPALSPLKPTRAHTPTPTPTPTPAPVALPSGNQSVAAAETEAPHHDALLLAPSILAADFANLANEVRAVLEGGAHWIHVDVFDGSHLARGNLTIGPCVVSSLHAAVPHAFLDCHLAVDDPGRYAEAVAKAGAASITFHLEAPGLLTWHDGAGSTCFSSVSGANLASRRAAAAAAFAAHLRRLGIKAALALEPETPPEEAIGLANAGLIDMVLVMSVVPGWGGQPFLDSVLPKIRAIRQAVGPRLRVQVDGGVNVQTGKRAVAAGADVLVAGSAVFGKGDPGKQDGAKYRDVISQLLRGTKPSGYS